MSANGLSSRRGYSVPNGLWGAARDVNELFDRLFDSPADSGASSRSWNAPASLWEEESQFHVEIDLPGVQADDLDVTMDDGKLSVSARRSDTEGRSYLHNERGFGEVRRTVTLPETVDPESIDASYANGVLHVTLSKRPEVQPRKIDVKTA